MAFSIASLPFLMSFAKAPYGNKNIWYDFFSYLYIAKNNML